MAAGPWTFGALAALAAAIVVGAWFVAADEAEPAFQRFEIGGEALTIPSAYLASEDGDAPQIVAFLPDLSPAGAGARITARTDLDRRFERLAFLRPTAADAALNPAERTARLYQRFLSPAPSPAPDGLAARAFVEDSPFRGDLLFYTPPEGREFAARCRRDDTASATPNTCVSLFRSGQIDVEVRFARQRIGDWREIVRAARRLVESWKR